MGKCKGMEGFGMSGTLNHDEIEVIYLSFVNDYKLCKRIAHNEAVEIVRTDVIEELQKLGMPFLKLV